MEPKPNGASYLDFSQFDASAQRRQLIKQSPLSGENQQRLDQLNALPEPDRSNRLAVTVWEIEDYFTESCGIGEEYQENLRMLHSINNMRGEPNEPK